MKQKKMEKKKQKNRGYNTGSKTVQWRPRVLNTTAAAAQPFKTRRVGRGRAGPVGGGRDRAEPPDQLCGAPRRPPFGFLATGPKKRGPPHRATASLTPTIYVRDVTFSPQTPPNGGARVYRVPRIYRDRSVIPGR